MSANPGHTVGQNPTHLQTSVENISQPREGALPEYMQPVKVVYSDGDVLETCYNKVNVPNPKEAANYWLNSTRSPSYQEEERGVKYGMVKCVSVEIEGIKYEFV